MRWTILVIAVAACHHEPDAKPPKLLDTGWFTTPVGTVDPSECADHYATWTPTEGQTGWYWRDRPTFYTQSTNQAAYAVYLEDAGGVRIDTTAVWDSELSFHLDWDGYLEANTTYTLGMADCSELAQVHFTTSSFGKPLDDGPSSLLGNTYLLDLIHADWVEPPILGGIIQQNFTDPVLLGIKYVDAARIDVLGAPGKTDAFGVVTQNTALSSWDVPLADFSEAPYLVARAPEIQLNYDTVQAPVYDFVLEGTFSADGTLFGGAVLSGFGDTRGLGTLLGLSDESAICDIAAGAGVNCEDCPDGGHYCLHLRATELNGYLMPGLHLVEDP